MPTQRIDLDVDLYADFTATPLVQAGGQYVDFTGCSAELDVRLEPTDTTTPLLSISTTPSSQGSIVLGTPLTGTPPQGGVQIKFARAQMVATFPTTGELLPYTCMVTWSDGTKSAVFGGYVRVNLGSAHTP